jgi:hypothetical protein
MARIGQLPAIVQDAIALSLIVVLAVLLPGGAGLLFDKTLKTAPWATLIGALGGISVGTMGVVRLVLRRFEQIAPRDVVPLQQELERPRDHPDGDATPYAEEGDTEWLG